MTKDNEICPTTERSFRFDLGTFEGFNFRSQSAIPRILTAAEVVGWDHDRQGEAEFWPAGDNSGVACVFSGRSAVTATELLDLDKLLAELGDDSTGHYLRIYYAVRILGQDLAELTRPALEDLPLHLFEGTNFCDLRKEAAYELFELYYPEEYRVWEKSLCDGLIFDTERFLDSPTWSVSEIELTDGKALIVAPQ